uniref:peptidylprolyl isomerase n=1 Tax=Corethron hystrix TaxID=216773 RepID=A0A7S1FTT1_9STRA|mmetsp:Transcript_30513/g.69843  ORF Transcript_30513/g.69843 Transcript_30513/m.69843 type:complete len:192 (+) Transcript_30513:235-810(+)|eukprot:CAMPEP_0113307970 /NCGR_PEP_ID=MMETSP0010_2-20120614/6599_1 /TAXON_ID=216773 ORGANISM="Corethron hystrix, Strain 308" /NCGR_SAMPLE_ID=MMETSP0010_2 /ASSEMBLY_ACC=CAM_ASM_000155 /LENGTH=191 /DNA_ID=CAMNT_0000162925 /DNA_START=201 /DNA_END=776 /DNA_ORIENTATION=- /assembly_acc=CAM_ASM_000155
MRNLLILLSLLLTPTCLCYTPFNPKISAAGTTRRKALSRVLNFVGVTTSAATILGTVAQPLPAYAAPTIYNTPKGVKYAVTAESNGPVPLPGDFVVVEYTGYLSNGQIFDATHATGKRNELLFKLNTGSVIPGLDEMVGEMKVGQKVQAIIPPALAYGDKGVCLENGECLIKPGSTLVYDILLKKTSIPPP